VAVNDELLSIASTESNFRLIGEMRRSRKRIEVQYLVFVHRFH
jgi:hypothetical protein